MITCKGACFCGTVEVETTGEPVVQGFCHCADCRAWSATPVTAFALWPAAMMKATRGEADLASFSRTEGTVRRHCVHCGGAVMTVNDGGALIDVYPPLLPGFAFRPRSHVHYGQRMVDMKDGLPKYRDLPARAGGSDEMIAE
ncbi:GFA family protein [Pikeienuella piscinae]|uniref:GFA family protein n=1 Tax=Pikeienuella piscinae TaxID=2748098 RepID=A0A7L5BYP4_9RHOB|nr:GFA family protein [Pikeienuella piscinae]QIE55958.1 GFA family protein [Pikeienuella piscinae]